MAVAVTFIAQWRSFVGAVLIWAIATALLLTLHITALAMTVSVARAIAFAYVLAWTIATILLIPTGKTLGVRREPLTALFVCGLFGALIVRDVASVLHTVSHHG